MISTGKGKLSRRGFLFVLTGSAVAVAAGCRPEGVVPPTPYVPGSTAVPTLPPSAGTAAAQVTPVADRLYGTVTYDKLMTTSADDLYDTQYDYSNTPSIDGANWTLKIDGLVENPVMLDYKTIQTYPVYEDMRTLECIGNPVGGGLIGNVQWKGFLFQQILDLVKPKPEAKFLKFEAADGYHTSVAMEWATQANTMMAYSMNGAPLTTVHGYPLRILMPGLYGQKMPRWLTHMEFIADDFIGFWESNGYSNIATVQTNSIVKTPQDGYSTKAGSEIAIQGVAWAGKRAITKVEVQIDKGPWMPAQLTHGASPLVWTQWYLTWVVPAPGSYQIGVRATDDAGFTQNAEADGIFGDSSRDGVTAIHRITLQGT